VERKLGFRYPFGRFPAPALALEVERGSVQIVVVFKRNLGVADCA